RDQGHRQGAASQKIGRELGTHKRSCPDSKHWPAVTMRSPDLNEVRVQRLTRFLDVTCEPERSEGSAKRDGKPLSSAFALLPRLPAKFLDRASRPASSSGKCLSRSTAVFQIPRLASRRIVDRSF
ncbi:MAG: hypothetical protein ACLQVJ_05950, partial [Syntrophobacteraceae bacterium]